MKNTINKVVEILAEATANDVIKTAKDLLKNNPELKEKFKDLALSEEDEVRSWDMGDQMWWEGEMKKQKIQDRAKRIQEIRKAKLGKNWFQKLSDAAKKKIFDNLKHGKPLHASSSEHDQAAQEIAKMLGFNPEAFDQALTDAKQCIDKQMAEWEKEDKECEKWKNTK